MRRRSLTPRVDPLEARPLTSSAGPGPALVARLGPAHLVVCEGNSLTAGAGSTNRWTLGYPAQLQARLGQAWKVLNLGVNGQSLGRMYWKQWKTFGTISAAVAQLPNSAHRSAITVVWEGTNSLRLRETGEAASRALGRFVAIRRQEGLKVIVLTCLPADPTEVGPQFEAERRIYNALVRKNAFRADAVVDVASDRRLMDPNSEYYWDDHLHLSDAGYAVVASLVAQAVRRLASPS